METKKKKIAIIGAKGLPGRDAMSRRVENLMPYLSDKYDFTIFCTAEYTNRPSDQYDGYKQITFSKISNIRLNSLLYYFKAVFYVLFKGNYDLIWFQHCAVAFLFPVLRLKYGKRIVVTTVGAFGDIDDKWAKYKAYLLLQYRVFLRFAPNLTTVSKNEKKKTKEYIGRQSEFIPNGINIDEPVSGEDVGTGYLFFAAGRIMAIKGLDIMLEALHTIKYKGKIKIAGDISMASQKFKDKVAELSVGLNIDNLGLITDKSLLYKYLHNAKLFINPTCLEAMSVQLLEAASMKVPIIVSDITENTDVFDPDEVLFFNVNDSTDLALKIEYALKNEKQMIDRAAKAYEKLEKDYTWIQIAEQYAEVFDKILTKE